MIQWAARLTIFVKIGFLKKLRTDPLLREREAARSACRAGLPARICSANASLLFFGYIPVTMFQRERGDRDRPRAGATQIDVGCIDQAAIDEADKSPSNSRLAHRNAMCQDHGADWSGGGIHLGEGEKNGELINQTTPVSEIEAPKEL